LFSFIQKRRIIPTIKSGLFSEPIIKAIINNIYQFLIKFILPTCLILGFIIISLDYGLKALKLSKTFTIPIENITSVDGYNYMIASPISSILTSVNLFHSVHPLITKFGKILIIFACSLFILRYANRKNIHYIFQKWTRLQKYFFTPLLYESSVNDIRPGIYREFMCLRSHIIMVLLGCVLFSLPLINAWMLFPIKPTTDILYGSMGGVIPWSDAAGYYGEANRLLETGRLDYFGTRRPLNAILFALRLWVTKGNFEFALIIQALLCGLSVSVLASLISKYFGRFAAILTIVPIFAFGMNYIPITLSESLGLTLGCLAFVLLWTGVLEKKISLAVAGIFMLTVGLNARAGAFFVLPLLIIWMGRAFSSPFQKYHWRALGFSILALAIAFGFNALLTALYGKPNGMIPHANFAHTLFGLASGGKGWTYALEVYAKEFDSLKDGFTPFLFTKSFELIINNSFLFIEALLKNASESLNYIFSFSKIDPSDSNTMAILRKLSLILFIFGTWQIKKHYKANKNIFELILIGVIGSLLSACLIWNDGGLRSFAVTVPFFAATFGVVMSLINRSGSFSTENNIARHWEGHLTIVTSGILIVVSIFLPLMIHNDKHRFQKTELSTLSKIKIRNISKTPYLTISNDSEKSLGIPALTRMIDQDSFIKLNPYWSDTLPIFLELLDPKKFKQPITIGVVYELTSREVIYIVGPRSIFENKQEYIDFQVYPMVSLHKENYFASRVFIVRQGESQDNY